MDFKKYLDQFRNLNPRDVGTWPIVPRVASAFGIVIAVMILGYFVLWSGQLDELDNLRQTELKLKDEYRAKLAQAINLEPLRKQRELVSQYVFRLEKQLPSKAEMDALLSDINQAGVGRGLQFDLFRPGQPTVKDYYAELPIAIHITGAYHDLAQFTSDIASLPRIVTLNNIAITAATPNTPLGMDATAKTFRYLDPDEVAQQKKTKTKAPVPK